MFDHISKTDKKGSRGRRRKLLPADWTDKCQKAFDTLTEGLLTSVMLAHPDIERDFIIAVDGLVRLHLMDWVLFFPTSQRVALWPGQWHLLARHCHILR